ncbi:hypothetical protein HN011_002177, partial [Eciton burchellii]
ATLGRARVIKQGCRHIIARTKTRASILTERAILEEALRSLYNVTLELNLQTISIFITDGDSVLWAYIKKILQELFYDFLTRIIVCHNRVTIPEPSDRNKIILENHASAIGGHKGMSNLPIRKVCVKTRQPIVLTDTAGTAFDKVSMDIVGSLPTTDRNIQKYTHDSNSAD